MAELNKGLIILFEIITAVGAILFMLGLLAELTSWAIPVSSKLGILLGSALILIGGFGLAFYISYASKATKAAAKN
ncbi:MAG: hypothetical protein LBE57_07095 [Methanosarcinales archaeon]|jgi:low temperature requirement protein LtrA|nr:hypothetical protein [Methanosarcinales archaeon]